ncbi:MAG: hypothetical protein WBD22_08805 [Pyrinomonadaceae bacterium]
MTTDPKRQLLRHMVGTVWFRGSIALANAPARFAEFRVTEDTRSSAEILAHIGDLLVGSYRLMNGEFVEPVSKPLPWSEETSRFAAAVKDLDVFLASDTPLAYPVEQFVQGPIGDALTHVGQIVMLRRIAGVPIQHVPYFSAEIVPGKF